MSVRPFGIRLARHHAAGIVDETIEAAEMVDRFVDDTPHIVRFRKVAPDKEDFVAGAAHFIGKLLGRIGAGIVVQAHARADLGEGPNQGRPDSCRSAGDEHRLALEVGNSEAVEH